MAGQQALAWANDRDRRFNSGLDTLFRRLQPDLGSAVVAVHSGASR
jgi:hypothetical protein